MLCLWNRVKELTLVKGVSSLGTYTSEGWLQCSEEGMVKLTSCCHRS